MSGRWEPRHEAHSIDVVAAAVAFAEPLNDIQIRKTLRAADAVAKAFGLGDVTAQPGVRLRIESGVVTPVDSAPTNGMAFKRNVMEEDETGNVVAVAAEELVVDREGVIIRSRRYTRWKQFEDSINAILPKILSGLLDSTAVRHVRLEYRDRFTFSGEPSAALTAELLQKGSPLIAPHVFDIGKMWHSHTGMFEDSAGVSQRLIQIEIGATDRERGTEKRRSIAIMTGLQDNFELTENLEAQDQTTDMIVSRFPGLHDHSKRIFRSLITKKVAKEIGLGEDTK